MDRDVEDDGISSGTGVSQHHAFNTIYDPTEKGAPELKGQRTEDGFVIEEASKWDGGKTKYSLIPPEALRKLAELYTDGGASHGDRNWEKGTDYSRWYDAMNRHLNAWWEGQEYDPDPPNHHHLIAAAWNAFALYTYTTKGIGNDDRPKI